jgi:hypothetical protein
MGKDEEAIEQEIIDKGLTAPRLTPALIDANIKNDQYYRFPGTNTTVCCITLNNDFTVTGESSCVSSANFDEALGKKIAFENARDKIWQLEGYLLAQNISEG